ncbi:2-keto-3-deoxy-galactonokinase [Falsiruegeria litorea R37]|uniref:2-keto-3-deoxy-galactonokinase n=1 Tax=Falsiruegeria litorea R37 TaxID=1200284 RepID=A0A1Y5TMR9_9RHOB|nr:2-dehydro-3-deoxygalactonokinase [Falsiruegeria litorea]SLN67762.1 2-keto-3-deoxy-galactonokinase [Falsiruegeria litorea R37]
MDTLPEWIAVDWTPVRRRAWAMRGDTVLDMATQVGPVETTRPAEALLDLISGFLSDSAVDVMTCGTLGPVGASVPCAPLSDGAWSVDMGDARVRLRGVSGLRQKQPVDLMQGDETRVAGFLSLNPEWDGVICIPGEHSRWIHVSAGEIVSFQTFMTGVVAATFLERTVPDARATRVDGAAFVEAVADAIAKPERVMARVYSIHAEAVLDGLEPEIARARLLGGLIGSELAAARPFWLGQQLAVVGEGELAQLYVDALAAQGAPAALADEPRMTRAGLATAWRTLTS